MEALLCKIFFPDVYLITKYLFSNNVNYRKLLHLLYSEYTLLKLGNLYEIRIRQRKFNICFSRVNLLNYTFSFHVYFGSILYLSFSMI